MKKTKAQQQFENGYEQGKLSVVSHLYYEFSNKKKVGKDKLLKFLRENYEEYVPEFGSEKQTPYEKRFCYMTTVVYRNQKVDVFVDDYGQQYYFYYKNKSYSCGAYNFEYEDYIHYIIDEDLDYILNLAFMDKRFFGAYCKYANHEHTKVDFTFRGVLIDTYDIDANDKDSLEKICNDCVERLNKLFDDPEFIKHEEERKAKGNLYFNEIVEENK